MWPFREKPDTRPATESALAIARSLRTEPLRWRIYNGDYLVHDTGVLIGTAGYTHRPNLMDEPDSNADVVSEAVTAWVAKVVTMPQQPPPATVESERKE